MFAGCFFLWANISNYVISYYHEGNPDLSYGFIFYVDTILVLFNTIGYQIGTFMLKKRVHPKLIISIGGGVALTGLFLCSYAEDIVLFISLYGALNGIGNGMLYMVPLVCGWEYFPQNKGIVTGLIVGSFGFASFGFGIMSTKLVNPHNE
jgi:MFS transporter, OFA family, oxalate/formate antiporter